MRYLAHIVYVKRPTGCTDKEYAVNLTDRINDVVTINSELDGVNWELAHLSEGAPVGPIGERVRYTLVLRTA